LPADHNSIFGGDSDVSDERAVPPPVRSLKRPTTTTSDDGDYQAPANKRQKSACSSEFSKDEEMNVFGDSDDEMPYESSNTPGPSKQPKSRPEPSAQKKPRPQELELSTLRKWRSQMVALWERRKTLGAEVSKTKRFDITFNNH
jgi:hypothetical protein